jgi:hypothetical protein
MPGLAVVAADREMAAAHALLGKVQGATEAASVCHWAQSVDRCRIIAPLLQCADALAGTHLTLFLPGVPRTVGSTPRDRTTSVLCLATCRVAARPGMTMQRIGLLARKATVSPHRRRGTTLLESALLTLSPSPCGQRLQRLDALRAQTGGTSGLGMILPQMVHPLPQPPLCCTCASLHWIQATVLLQPPPQGIEGTLPR